jgi:hypothetical protein
MFDMPLNGRIQSIHNTTKFGLTYSLAARKNESDEIEYT